MKELKKVKARVKTKDVEHEDVDRLPPLGTGVPNENESNEQGTPAQAQPTQQAEAQPDQSFADKKMQELMESIEDYITSGGGLQGGNQQSQGDTNGDGEQQESESEGQPEDGSDEPKQPQDEDESENSSNSCSESERQFLDAFLEIQKAGKLLGMVTSGDSVANTKIFNTRIFPITNKVQESDKHFASEIVQEAALHEMFGEKVDEMFELAQKLITEHTKKELEK